MRLSLSRVVAIFVFSCGTVKARRLSDAVEPLPGPEKEDDEYARGRHCDPQKVRCTAISLFRTTLGRLYWCTAILSGSERSGGALSCNAELLRHASYLHLKLICITL